MQKLRNNVGYHNRGEPYPEHDFSELEGLNLSWASSQACLNNGDVARILEAQYNKDPKRTVGQYFYYTLFKEETENGCTTQT